MITDAAPSADDHLRSRRRRYTVLMVIHLVGLAVGGSLYNSAWDLGLAILIVTGPLQWVAVILANGAPRRRPRSPHGQADFPIRPRGGGRDSSATGLATERATPHPPTRPPS